MTEDKKNTAEAIDVKIDNSLESMKHPLEHTWTLWLYTNKSKDWKTNLVQLTSFNTVEEYWCLYHYMKTPSELRLGQDYNIFKQGIEPMWEDPANKLGGRWRVEGLKNLNVDRIWLDTLLLAIGENFSSSDIICGVVVNVRAESKVSIWTRNKDKNENLEIGKMLKRQLQLRKDIHFYAHNKNTSLYRV